MRFSRNEKSGFKRKIKPIPANFSTTLSIVNTRRNNNNERFRLAEIFFRGSGKIVWGIFGLRFLIKLGYMLRMIMTNYLLVILNMFIHGPGDIEILLN